MTTFLPGFLALLLCQLVGEALSRLLALPLPGPVLGLLLMTAILLARRGRTPKSLVHASRALIGILSLMFVPAGVGLISLGKAIEGQATALVAALVVSVIVTLAVTAGVFALVSRWQERRAAAMTTTSAPSGARHD